MVELGRSLPLERFRGDWSRKEAIKLDFRAFRIILFQIFTFLFFFLILLSLLPKCQYDSSHPENRSCREFPPILHLKRAVIVNLANIQSSTATKRMKSDPRFTMNDNPVTEMPNPQQ
jgi:hypothetical protein